MRKLLLLALLLLSLPAWAQNSGYKILNLGGCSVASTTSIGCVQPDGASVTIHNGVISAPTAGGGNVTGAGSSTAGNIVTWANTAGNLLAVGLPVGTSGNSTVVETTSGGLLNTSIMPIDGSTIAVSGGKIAAVGNAIVSGTSGQITVSGTTPVTLSLPSTITAALNFTGAITVNGLSFAPVAFSGDAGDLSSGRLLAARLGGFTGDVTSPGGTYTLTLPNQAGLVAGTYPCATVTVVTKGLVTGISSPSGSCTGGGGGVGESIALDSTHSLALDSTHALRLQ